MAARIEDYALIGDRHTAALVSDRGAIDWLCLPRFDSPSVFGALLGDEEHGHWTLAPVDPDATATREYVDGSVVLRTTWTTAAGVVEVTDLMPLGGRRADLIRRVRGVSGAVRMRHVLRLRFDLGAALPWVRQLGGDDDPVLLAVAGPDAIAIRGLRLRAHDHSHRAEVDVEAGQTHDAVATWFPAHRDDPGPVDVDERIGSTLAAWREWSDRIGATGADAAAVERSLVLLRALTHEDTGGIVAAATTSLPERLGGERNWDYRYVWLRDASLTLTAFLRRGLTDEARAWRGWLLRAIAGDPKDVQIMYGLAGERRLDERVVDSLPGHRGSAPVRVGNGAFTQYQGDVFGEVLGALHEARLGGLPETPESWALQRALLHRVEEGVDRLDQGIWEVRGPERAFTHSRVMLWAALDAGVRAVEECGLRGPVERWRELRERVAARIEERGFDPVRGSYRQHEDTDEVDASLLMLPQVGYVAADDPRMLGTVRAIEEDLLHGGLLLRYRTDSGVDGLAGGEHPFLACSFWLVEQYAASGRLADARALLDRLLAAANDVGMLPEELDTATGEHRGNTPQALSHLALVRAAAAIEAAGAGSSPGS